MADRYQAWIEGAAAERPALAAPLAELGELYQRKLWHQLTVQLEQVIEQPEFQEGGFLVALYQNFVAGFAHKVNLLKLAFFAVAVGKQMASPDVRALHPASLATRLPKRLDVHAAKAARMGQHHVAAHLPDRPRTSRLCRRATRLSRMSSPTWRPASSPTRSSPSCTFACSWRSTRWCRGACRCGGGALRWGAGPGADPTPRWVAAPIVTRASRACRRTASAHLRLAGRSWRS